MAEEITTISWGTRIKDAFVGILVGIGLIIGAIALIFWNERHSLHTAQSLQYAHKILISVPATPVDNQNNLKVVYFNGLATTQDKLTDKLLDITENAISLKRSVQMYQWEEHVETRTESQVGGSEKQTKTYTYSKVWSDHFINSSNFKESVNHQNPASMPIQAKQEYADSVTVGAFTLPHELITQIDVSKPVDLASVNKTALQNQFKKPVTLANNELYFGESSETPRTGDLRVSLSAVYPQNVSIIGQQTSNTVQPFLAPAGESVFLLSTGEHSPDQMIAQAESENKLIAWILRLVSLLLLIGGFSLILKPLAVLADVLPFLGSIVGFGTGFVAFLAGLSVWLIATAIAWFTSRPLLSIGLVAVAVIGGYFLIKMRSRQPAKTNTL